MLLFSAVGNIFDTSSIHYLLHALHITPAFGEVNDPLSDTGPAVDTLSLGKRNN